MTKDQLAKELTKHIESWDLKRLVVVSTDDTLFMEGVLNPKEYRPATVNDFNAYLVPFIDIAYARAQLNAM